MGKAKREAKRARRQARGTEAEQAFLEAERAAERARRRRKIALLAVPALAAAVAGGLYFGLDDGQAAGIALLLGVILFFLVGLGALGSAVPVRDRDRAGSIDFGSRR